MLASNPTGVAVQLVKWYQCMTVNWQLNDRHHIQIFKAVPLDSYVIFYLWSAVLQLQVIPYSRLQYFSTLSLKQHDFLKKHLFINGGECVTEVTCATWSVSCVGLPHCQYSAAAHLLLTSPLSVQCSSTPVAHFPTVSTVQQHTCCSSAQWLCLLLQSNSTNTKCFISVATAAQWIQQKIKCVFCRAFLSY
jgi:hypothetical protein